MKLNSFESNAINVSLFTGNENQTLCVDDDGVNEFSKEDIFEHVIIPNGECIRLHDNIKLNFELNDCSMFNTISVLLIAAVVSMILMF